MQQAQLIPSMLLEPGVLYRVIGKNVSLFLDSYFVEEDDYLGEASSDGSTILMFIENRNASKEESWASHYKAKEIPVFLDGFGRKVNVDWLTQKRLLFKIEFSNFEKIDL